MQAQESHDNCDHSVENKLDELNLQTSSMHTLDSTKEEVLPEDNEFFNESATGMGVTSTEIGEASSSNTDDDQDVPLELLR